ncbi:MAG: hypothetical protein ABSH36_07010, partial [Solirubrobacteraceae bacterium]
NPNLGRLVQPRHYNALPATIARGVPWAADNDCYQGKRDLFLLMSVLFVGGCGFLSVTGVASGRVGGAENLGKSGKC